MVSEKRRKAGEVILFLAIVVLITISTIVIYGLSIERSELRRKMATLNDEKNLVTISAILIINEWKRLAYQLDATAAAKKDKELRKRFLEDDKELPKKRPDVSTSGLSCFIS